MLKYSEAVDNLPEFNIFSERYEQLAGEILEKHSELLVGGIDLYEELSLRGEEIWGQLEKEFGILLYHEVK